MNPVRQIALEALSQFGIPFTLTDHPAAYTVDEIDAMHLENEEYVAKNLFLRDDKKCRFYLLVLRKDKRADLKDLRAQIGSRPLGFASEEMLLEVLRLPKGSVTPLGILNDDEKRTELLIDGDILNSPLVGVHPNENTATIWLRPSDLLTLAAACGTPVRSVIVRA